MYVLFATVIIVLIITIVLGKSKRKFAFWKNKGVPYVKPVPIFGNYFQYILQKKYLGQVTQELCQKFPNEPYFGTFYGTEPTLIVQSPEVIKQIFTKDFYYFNGREISNYSTRETITQNIFFTYGDRWKVIRQNVTPLFSSAKMRSIFYLIKKCALELENMLDIETSRSDVQEVRSLMIRYTMDCIGSCAFGIEMNVMQSDSKDNIFRIMGDTIFDTSFFSGFKFVARSIWPKIFYALKLRYFSAETDKFFHDMLSNVFKERNYKPSTRNDFIDYVLNFCHYKYVVGDSITNPRTGESSKVRLEVDDKFLIGMCVAFFAAGFQTSATTLCFTLCELAKNEEVQKLAHDEIDTYYIVITMSSVMKALMSYLI
ncbi:hypothetical protein K1T71_011092 [Dendrolimus kikuchii]|uniref:Uncharacterized protein n=1 Tax=Dendrolimus kikuchii TaxID=765133 RepID=A0ACC1CN16_9NEOP|nr:hypothetical protein K1T71_011092 [Dendrolimus kikuchii]